MKLFDSSLIFIPSDIGFSKYEPDRNFYRYAIAPAGVVASKILFIDDSAANIVHAAETGITTFFFDKKHQSTPKLVSDLRAQLLPGQSSADTSTIPR